jgi:hypothetical protein
MDAIEEPGDYWYNPRCDDDGGQSLWFMLPIATSRDQFAEPFQLGNGLNRIATPPWTITENPDGSVSAQPSIAIEGHDPGVDAPGAVHQFWHGYLEPGNVWRQV